MTIEFLGLQLADSGFTEIWLFLGFRNRSLQRVANNNFHYG